MKNVLSAAFITLLALGSYASANSIVFSDNFNTENGGNGQLNYFGFNNWTVPTGSVDLIGQGTVFDFLPGNGLYVDLDGSTGQAGAMVSKSLSLSAGNYVFQFDLAGDQRNAPPEPVTASVSGGLASQTYLFPSAQPFTVEELTFSLPSPQSVQLMFSETGTSNMGMLLDDVSLSSVSASAAAPLPSTAGGGLVMIACLAAVKIRRKVLA